MSNELLDLAHEIWAMAQGPQPIEEACANISQRLRDGAVPAVWISVKDRLPEPHVEVLVWQRHKGGDFEVGMTFHSPEDVGTHMDFGCAGWLYGSAENVETTHWMPLPTAPTYTGEKE